MVLLLYVDNVVGISTQELGHRRCGCGCTMTSDGVLLLLLKHNFFRANVLVPSNFPYHFGGSEMDVAMNVIDGGCDDFLIVVGRHFSLVGLFIFPRRFLHEKGCRRQVT